MARYQYRQFGINQTYDGHPIVIFDTDVNHRTERCKIDCQAGRRGHRIHRYSIWHILRPLSLSISFTYCIHLQAFDCCRSGDTTIRGDCCGRLICQVRQGLIEIEFGYANTICIYRRWRRPGGIVRDRSRSQGSVGVSVCKSTVFLSLINVLWGGPGMLSAHCMGVRSKWLECWWRLCYLVVSDVLIISSKCRLVQSRNSSMWIICFV